MLITHYADWERGLINALPQNDIIHAGFIKEFLSEDGFRIAGRLDRVITVRVWLVTISRKGKCRGAGCSAECLHATRCELWIA